MNPATRIISTIKSVSKVNKPVHTAISSRWTVSLLQQGDTVQALDSVNISQRLVAIVEQVNVLAELLEQSNCPQALYQPHLNAIKQSLSPNRLHESWATVSKGFANEHMTTLRWAEWLVGPLETDLTAEDRAIVEGQINELNSLMESDTLPNSMRRILRAQINELQNALDRYQTEGISPLEKAIKTITADIVSEKESLAESAKSHPDETRSALTKLKLAMTKIADVTDRTAKTTSSLRSLWALAGEAIDKIPF